MNEAYMQVIKNECEKIEKSTGHGEVLIQITNGAIRMIKPTSFIQFQCQKEAIDFSLKRD